ncbi:MAG: molybdopterin converting factor subunit 1 [Ignavibacteriae bacterium]|nr:molybdopterin converting factor subunit 1 [Ignavibacteriota bacterium]
MNIQVKFFAVTRDIVGASQKTIALPEQATTNDLLEHLIHCYPKFAEWKPFIRIAVNHEYIIQERVLSEQDEVALIPPVSGG